MNTFTRTWGVSLERKIMSSHVAQAYYESPEQHPTYLLNYSYDNSYKTLYENYPISPLISPRWLLSTVIWVKNCRSKKGIKQCLGGLKCSQNTKKNKKTLKVFFKAIFNVNFANLVSKEYFSIQRLIINLLYE